MKLLSKTSLLIITASIFIFWIGNIAFFFTTRQMISSQINSELMTRMTKVLDQLNNNNNSPELPGFSDEVSIRSIEESYRQRPVFIDTVIYNSARQNYIAHRALRFTYQTDGGNNEITIYKSLLSSDKLIERISISSIILLIAFIIVIYALNRFIFANVWSSFSSSLEKVDEYDFKNLDRLALPVSEIDEFDRLNKVLLEMAERIQSDYRSLKELTANTSHEIQTPLAIIRAKAELLLQSKNMSKDEMETVSSIMKTTGRLSKLNQSLLLITKIENKQFEDSEIIDLDTALNTYIEDLEILIEAGGFTLTKSIDNCVVEINQVLLDVLISNLMKNALTHGAKESTIGISMKDCKLTITNQGEPLPFDSKQLFKRFIKDSGKEGSTGIGLEIVRKVCDYYRILVAYKYTGKEHSFSLDFSEIIVKD
jgi:signal transduction histidine kinase